MTKITNGLTKFLPIVLILFGASQTYACTISNSDGTSAGKLGDVQPPSHGYSLYDSSGKLAGQVFNDVDVYNAGNKKVGHIISGVVFDNKNVPAGEVRNGTSIYDNFDNLVGQASGCTGSELHAAEALLLLLQ